MKATRELFGFGILPFILADIIFLPEWVFVSVLALALVGTTNEMLTMALSEYRPIARPFPLLLTLIIMASSWYFGPSALIITITTTLIVLPALQMTRPETPKGSLNGVGVACFIVLYIGVTGTCMGWIRSLSFGNDGYQLLILFLASIWGGDTGGYYVGKNLGRHKMAPRVSPKKTWEGLAGGIVGSIAGTALLKIILGNTIAWEHIIALAGLSSIFGPVGDLVISQFKRDTGVKDSSSILPGHGGLLDRADSLLFAAPPFLGYLLWAGIVSFP